MAAFADRADGKAAIGLARRLDHIAQRYAILAQPGRIGSDPDLLRSAARDEGEADIIDLGNLGAQFCCEVIQRLIGPPAGRTGLWRECEHHHRDVVDPAHGDLGIWNADRNPVPVGVQLLFDPRRCILGVGPDQEARRHHHAIVFGLRIDMLDAIDALDDRLERNADKLDRVGRCKPWRHHLDVHHRHADLRLFLARYREDCEETDGYRRHEEQWRQRRADRGASQPAGEAKVHLPLSARNRTSPAATPLNISTFAGSAVDAIWTGTALMRWSVVSTST